jgi:hypothetical protein
MPDIITDIVFETDKASVTKAKSETSKIQKDLEVLNKRQATLAKSTADVGDAFKKAYGATGAKSVDQTTDALKKQKKQLDKNLSAIELADKRFSEASRNAALAGDVESNVRTVGGAIGRFGGGALESKIGGGAEVFAVVEAIPRLKAAAKTAT